MVEPTPETEDAASSAEPTGAVNRIDAELDDAPPPLVAPYAKAAADAMPPSLVDDDNRTGRIITILLCGLFTYTLLAMGYVVYVTSQWTSGR